MPEQSKIIATSQQSRFHTETLDTSIEVDLKDVTISIGDRELIVGSRLKLKEGVRYALVGRCVSRAALEIWCTLTKCLISGHALVKRWWRM